MKNQILLLLCAACLLTIGCSSDHHRSLHAAPGNSSKAAPKNHPSDFAALQGDWHGRVLQRDTDHPCSFAVSGHNFEFHDLAETNVWYKGTFSLREDTTPRQYLVSITDCPFPQYLGQSSTAIYQLIQGTLTMTANEPGSPSIPTSFDSPDAARLEVKRR
jgi:uncharacterized protein (TIGR03067 family)